MKFLAVTFLGLAIIFSIKNNDDLPINKIQVIGSHNSYKQAIDPALFEFFKQKDSVAAYGIDYSHIALESQLDLGLRNLEIDVYADSKGGKYAKPKGLEWVKNQPAYDAGKEMLEPGFKVLHVQDLDFRSSVLTFKAALIKLRKWYEVNPDHTPIFITLEGKDDKMSIPGLASPENFTQQVFDELDKVIIENLGLKHIIMPDNVRGNFKTLEEAVLNQKWPTVKASKGKFMFVLDAVNEKRTAYIKDHPSLAGRIMFANAEPGNPEAAFLIRNNPNSAEIPALVKKGYIIRTRADSGTKQARENDYTNFKAACASGAQIITTDYYQKSTHFKSDYIVKFNDGKYFRKNPLF